MRRRAGALDSCFRRNDGVKISMTDDVNFKEGQYQNGRGGGVHDTQVHCRLGQVPLAFGNGPPAPVHMPAV